MKDTKTLINPLKNWLLSQGKCVGCGRELAKGKKRTKDGIDFTICTCRRIFAFDRKIGGYRLHQDSLLLGLVEKKGGKEDEKFLSGYFY